MKVTVYDKCVIVGTKAYYSWSRVKTVMAIGFLAGLVIGLIIGIVL